MIALSRGASLLPHILLASLGTNLITACSTSDNGHVAGSSTGGAANASPDGSDRDSDANQGSRAFAYAAALGRGINLGNALEAPNEGDWGVTLTDTDFDLIQSAGFNHVRIPVRFSGHADTSPPYAIDPTFLARVDWAIHSALDRGLEAVVDMHNYDELFADPAGQGARFVGLWKQLGEHYADFPDGLSLEILNEPHGSVDAATANDLMAQSLAAIRSSNRDRMVIMAPADWSHIEDLPTLTIPDDPDVIATIHYYDPEAFTHQGASWTVYATQTGVDWPGAVGDDASMAAQFDAAASWSERQSRPLYVGEFGAIHFADIAARGRWTSAVVSKCDAHQFPYAYWELRSDFGAWDPTVKAWHKELIDAVLPGNTIPASNEITGNCIPAVIPDSPDLRVDSFGWTTEDYVQSSTAPPVPDQVRDLAINITLGVSVTAFFVISVDSVGKAAPIGGYVAEWDTIVDDSSPLSVICSPYTGLQTWAIAVVENGTVLNTATGEIPLLTASSERHLSLHLGDPKDLEGSGAVLRVFAVTADGTLIASSLQPTNF